MNLLLNIHPQITPLHSISVSSSKPPTPSSSSSPLFLPLISSTRTRAFHSQNVPTWTATSSSPLLSFLSKREFRNPRVSIGGDASTWSGGVVDDNDGDEFGELEDLATDGAVYNKTLRLVECSMFAAVAGLAYFLSNSLSIENYFGCFFSLPIVISSMRWDLAAGRKTMVATAMLLLTLAGPVKASTYLLMHGIVGLAMGTMWTSGADWRLSIAACTLVRAVGAVGYVLITSFLIRENILALITVNIHASLTFMLTAIGVNTIPSMNLIYSIFGMVLLLNCVFFVFLLHILYAVFLTRLGMKASLRLPRWLAKAI